MSAPPAAAEKEELFYAPEETPAITERSAEAVATDCLNRITLRDTGQIIGSAVPNAPLAPRARAIFAADLDGNGSKDLISGAYNAGVSLYTNNGSGAYSIRLPVLKSTQSQAVSAADIDRDGDNDVVIGDYLAGMTVYRNLGNWQFQLIQTVAGGGITAIAAVDVDNRNGVDLIVANYKFPTKVCFNNGVGVFACSGTIGTDIQTKSLAVADFDRDGKPDVAQGNYRVYPKPLTQTIRIWKNNGSGVFSLITQTTTNGLYGINALAASDVDRDGDNDLVVASYIGGVGARGQGMLLTNNGAGIFTNASLSGLDVWNSNTVSMAVEDFDGDLYPDIVTGNYVGATNYNEVWFNTGDGKFKKACDSAGFVSKSWAVFAVDVDGDGKMDIIDGAASNVKVWKTGPYVPAIACSANSDCVLPNRYCLNPGRAESVCIPCMANADCNDSNTLTTDVCNSPGTATATCVNTACPVACSSDANCNDSSYNTVDACSNPGTCSASCSNTVQNVTVTASVSPTSGRTSDSYTVTCNGTGGTVQRWEARCSATSAWSVIATGNTKICSYSSPGTNTPACRANETSTASASVVTVSACLSDSHCSSPNPYCLSPGTTSAACIACRTTADCNDSNAMTTDVCNSPNTSSSSCSNTLCPIACSSDANCNDSNYNTVDTCINPGTCSASCSNVAQNVTVTASVSPTSGRTSDTYTVTCNGTGGTVQRWEARCSATSAWSVIATGNTKICSYSSPGTNTPACRANETSTASASVVTVSACLSDSHCSSPTPYCLSPGTDSASCIACRSTADCNDSNALTVDTCNSPNTTSSSCSNAACAIECSSDANCNDGLYSTVDSCSNPGTCSADCNNAVQNVTVTASVSPTSGRTSDTYTVTCNGTGGTVQRWEARCSATSAWSVIATGNTKICSYSSPGTNTPACRANEDAEASAGVVTVSACLSDSHCSSPNPYCLSPGTTSAACIACRSTSDCNDSNALTIDTCNSPNTTSSSCSNVPCAIDCSSDANCNDGLYSTVDSCSNPGTCSAECDNEAQSVNVTATITTTVGRTSDTYVLSCLGTGGTVQLWEGRCSGSSAWTTLAGTTRNCTYPAVGTYTPACRANELNQDDASVVTVAECIDDSNCSSPTPYCLAPATVAADCITCRSDADCGDGNAFTTDTCSSANTSASACAHTPCSAICSSDADCAGTDSDMMTEETCSNPGVCAAACIHTPMTLNVTASVNATTGTISSQFTLTCGATGGTISQLEGRCSSSDSWSVLPGTTKTCSYPSLGTYQPSCRANGSPTANSSAITISGVAPVATASSSATTGAAPLAVTFTGSCSDADGSCVSYLWDFGDGTTSASQNTSHTFSTTGGYTVTLTVTDNDGLTHQATVAVGVVVPIKIAAGGNHTCAITSTGGLKCWGGGASGQIGNGANLSAETSAKNVTGLSSGVLSVAAGHTFTCAITTGGVKCWGLNSSGQLGDGTTTNRNTPVSVSGLGSTSGVAAIEAGYNFACVIISGSVKCWGGNASSQLGNGSTTNSSVPVSVAGLTDVTAISLGGSHACALLAAGTVKCWGNNSKGQLGNSSTVNSSTPVTVTGLSGVTAIATGGLGQMTTCAILSGGAMKCWGYNNKGQVGDGTLVDRNSPVSVGTVSGIAAVSQGFYHNCAMSSGGGAYCWGYNDKGQIGNGLVSDVYAPVGVSTLSSGVEAIAAGGFAAGHSHTCALLSTNVVKCWGGNVYGQIGNGALGPTANRTTPTQVNGF